MPTLPRTKRLSADAFNVRLDSAVHQDRLGGVRAALRCRCRTTLLLAFYIAGYAGTTEMFPLWEATTPWGSDVAYAERSAPGMCQTSRRGIEGLRTMLSNTLLALYRFVAVSLRKRRGRIKERPERWRCEKGSSAEGGVSKNVLARW